MTMVDAMAPPGAARRPVPAPGRIAGLAGRAAAILVAGLGLLLAAGDAFAQATAGCG